MGKHHIFEIKSIPRGDRLLIEGSFVIAKENGATFRKADEKARSYALNRLNWELLAARLPRLHGLNEARCKETIEQLKTEVKRLTQLISNSDRENIEAWLCGIVDKTLAD